MEEFLMASGFGSQARTLVWWGNETEGTTSQNGNQKYGEIR